MRGIVGRFAVIAALVGFVGCGSEADGVWEPESLDHSAEQNSLTTMATQLIAQGTVPGIPSELSGMTRGDGYFFGVHRGSNGHLVITQLRVENWAQGRLRNLAQGSVAFNDPEGLSYIDKVGSSWRFVAASERGQLRIVEMNGNTLTLKASIQVGTYGNDGIEGVCFYNGYVYYGIQRDGKVYRVRFNQQTGAFAGGIESVPSTATSVRDMSVIGSGLYSISGTRITRIAGTGSAEIRSPVSLRQIEGLSYAAEYRTVMVVGEPNEYVMFTYTP